MTADPGMDARMPDGLVDILEQLHARGVEHDAAKADRLDRLRNLEPDSAALLSVLVRTKMARDVLELGTSNGYSTLWLAEAVRSTGGRLVSVELDPHGSAEAARNLARADLAGVVDLRVADAGVVIAESDAAAWDVVFLDAERSHYASYWSDLRRILRPGALLAVDNVRSHADDVAAFRGLIDADPTVRSVVVPTGAGVLLVVAGG